MLKQFVKLFGGDPVKRALKTYLPLVEQVNALEPTFEGYSDEALRAKTIEFRRRLAQGETLDDLLPEAFAVVREASKRTIGLRHYDVQIIGGAVLHQGKVAEMKTGEGKTLVATLPLYLNALTLNPEWVELARAKWGNDPERWVFEPLEGVPVGRGVHLVTVNDYLARRDARWMAPIYDLLGLSVGVLQMASRTENGKKAFLVDLSKTSPQEDQHQLRMVPRREAYQADIVYGTNSEFGFDYLRDNMAMRWEDRVQRGHHYAIIDEVDNVLIDEARTPLIISGPAQEAAEWYVRMAQIVRRLKPGEDVEINERDRTVTLTEIGEAKVEDALGMPLRDPERPEDLTPQQEQIWGYLEQALRAQFLFKKNKDYIVQSGKVIIVDEFTGRLMPGRRWSDGLHQAVEAKEGVRVQPENITYATITIQNYFRMYEKLAGMTGTAATEAEEFHEIYNLDVVIIPTNLEYLAARPDTDLVALEAVDEEGYRYTYYADKNDPEKKPLYWKRKDYPDVIYRTEEAKLRAIVWEILRFHIQGRPILVGTTSVEKSERLSRRLNAESLRRLALVMLLRDAFLRQGDREEGRQYPELEPLYRPLEKLNMGELRNYARKWGIPANPEKEENLQRLRELLLPTPTEQSRWEEVKPRLAQALRAGVPHHVLNARKHAEESQIIAGAGAFGAVTIATNMAGRGVDIKLGGELAEEILTAVNRVLKRAGYEDPYDLRLDERYQALKAIPPEQYGIYEAEVRHFLQYIEDMHRVREVGGLHVIGSERHESRRIDNQLRGRSARQGDPGSSRFFLSLEDELVRLFGGQTLENVMARFQVDELVPLEHGLVNRVIEQAQARVEGANFDMRKHLLEYDDVLNQQRAKIYAQRDRVFLKDDLTEDVNDLLKEEIRRRVAEIVAEPQGAWRLLAYLEQIQPPLVAGNAVYPSFTLRLLLGEIPAEARRDFSALRAALLDLTRRALQAEHEHLRHWAEETLAALNEHLDEALRQREEALDTFLEGLLLAQENGEGLPRRDEVQQELQSLLQIPVRLTNAQWQALQEDPWSLKEDLLAELEDVGVQRALRRALRSLERVVNAELGVTEEALWRRLEEDEELPWEEALLQALDAYLQRREARLFGNSGIPADLDAEMKRLLRERPALASLPITDGELLTLFLRLQEGQQTTFDRKTHRAIKVRTTRLRYIYLAGGLLDTDDAEALTELVLEHLRGAQDFRQKALGTEEWQRLKGVPPRQLPPQAQRGLRRALGDEVFDAHLDTPLGAFPTEYHPRLVDELGRQVLTEIYRTLLLHSITNAWVEFLTRMEALRVSIGLEAYAQRDPLVQYKAKAFEEYERLIREIRSRVVNHLFTYRPVGVQVAAERKDSSDEQEAKEPSASAAAPTDATPSGSKKKRRRRRRKKK